MFLTFPLFSDLSACLRERDARKLASPAQTSRSAVTSSSCEGPLKKDGTPDRRVAFNKQSASSMSSLPSYSSASGPIKKDGTPDMRSAANKSCYDDPSSSGYWSGGSFNSTGSLASLASPGPGPLKSDGTPDVRYAANRSSNASPYSYGGSTHSYGSSSSDGTLGSIPDMRSAANKSCYDDSSSPGYWSGGSFYSTGLLTSLASPCPLESDGTPDMRYAANRSSNACPYSYGGSTYSSGSSSIDGTPSGTPGIRYVANKSCYDDPSSSGYWSGGSFYSTGSLASLASPGPGPLKSDGTPDVRYAANRSSNASPYSYGGSTHSYGSSSSDGTLGSIPDMRSAANKSCYDDPSSPGYWSGGSFYSTGLLTSLASPCPLESDGTPDMKYAANRSSNACPYSYGGSTYSSGSSSIDGTPSGTPDIRYAANKSGYDDPSSSGYWSGGSFYSAGSLASLASPGPGPLKSDGTPDMKYAANRSSNACPYSYGGSTYSSGSSSIDGTPSGTPDIRYAANKSGYDDPSSSGYWSGGSFYSAGSLASLASPGPGPLKSDGTPDMRYAANKALYGSSSSYGGSTYSSGSSSTDGTQKWGKK